MALLRISLGEEKIYDEVVEDRLPVPRRCKEKAASTTGSVGHVESHLREAKGNPCDIKDESFSVHPAPLLQIIDDKVVQNDGPEEEVSEGSVGDAVYTVSVSLEQWLGLAWLGLSIAEAKKDSLFWCHFGEVRCIGGCRLYPQSCEEHKLACCRCEPARVVVEEAIRVRMMDVSGCSSSNAWTSSQTAVS